MPTITLAKALKLKNRLAGRLNKTQQDIQTYNSVLEDQFGKVNVIGLLELRETLVDNLISLKSSIVFANSEIQSDLIRQGEYKSALAWLQTLSTVDGKQRHYHQNTDVVYKATLTKDNLDREVRLLESQIDAIQDTLDEFNNSKKIEVPQAMLDIAS